MPKEAGTGGGSLPQKRAHPRVAVSPMQRRTRGIQRLNREPESSEGVSRGLAEAWLDWCIDLACLREGAHWSGARKILQNQTLRVSSLRKFFSIEDLGYTKYKLTRLNDQYLVEDAVEVAMMLHRENVRRRKYASSAFHCYGHLLKATFENRSKRGSVMGPCLQSVVVTLLPHERRTKIDVLWRTTEAFKKLPADFLWLRDYVIPKVPGQEEFPITEYNFHFVNVTIHPMYFATAVPLLPDPVATLELIKDRDPAMHGWIGKWMVRYVIGGPAGRSIEKFAQAQRTAQASVELLSRSVETGSRIVDYLCRHKQEFTPKNTRFDRDAMLNAYDEAQRFWRAKLR